MRVEIERIAEELLQTSGNGEGPFGPLIEWERMARYYFFSEAYTADERRLRARVYWHVLSQVLREYCLLRGNRETQDVAVLPDDVVNLFYEMSVAFSTGRIPDVVTAVRGPGRSASDAAELKHMEIVHHYVDAAKSGSIDDPAPCKTAAERFGVDRRTIGKWLQRASGRHDIEFLYRPADLPQLLEEAARHYRQNGRSYDANRRRAEQESIPPISGPVAPFRSLWKKLDADRGGGKANP